MCHIVTWHASQRQAAKAQTSTHNDHIRHVTPIDCSTCMPKSVLMHMPFANPERAEGVRTLENHKAKGFLSNTGSDPLENHKGTKPAFNVGPTSARQRNAI